MSVCSPLVCAPHRAPVPNSKQNTIRNTAVLLSHNETEIDPKSNLIHLTITYQILRVSRWRVKWANASITGYMPSPFYPTLYGIKMAAIC